MSVMESNTLRNICMHFPCLSTPSGPDHACSPSTQLFWRTAVIAVVTYWNPYIFQLSAQSIRDFNWGMLNDKTDICPYVQL